MSSIFEALGNFQNKKKDKKHFAKIEGKDIEVTLEQKLSTSVTVRDKLDSLKCRGTIRRLRTSDGSRTDRPA